MDLEKKIIYGKTAALFSAACECSAISGGQGADLRVELRDYGCNAGYAFQMKDDLLDYFGTQEVIGKKPGTDMDERKVTLPVILLLQELSGAEKQAFCGLFESDMDSGSKFKQILDYFEKYNIHQKASEVVMHHAQQALENLAKFEDSPYKEAMIALTEELNYRIA